MRKTVQTLLTYARRHSPEVHINPREDGLYEVIWFRRHAAHLRSVFVHTAKTPEMGLRFLLHLESSWALRRAHGDTCECEDCCIARIDASRSRQPS